MPWLNDFTRMRSISLSSSINIYMFSWDCFYGTRFVNFVKANHFKAGNQDYYWETFMIQFLNKPSLTLLLGFIFLSLVLFTGCEQDPLPTQSSTAGDRSVEKSLSKSLSMNDRTSGRFIVTFKGRPDHAVVQEAGGSVVYSYNIIPAMAVKGPQEFITNLAANPSVLRIEPDKKVFALPTKYAFCVAENSA